MFIYQIGTSVIIAERCDCSLRCHSVKQGRTNCSVICLSCYCSAGRQMEDGGLTIFIATTLYIRLHIF